MILSQLRYLCGLLGRHVLQGRFCLTHFILLQYRIDLGQQIALLYAVAKLDFQRFQLAIHLRADIDLANRRQRAGREHDFLDIATRRSADDIQKRLPSMYHQFMELAGVDITREAMEIGPTCHYIMGGVKVDADTAATAVAGLFAAGEVAGGMHGANRLGGNGVANSTVFGGIAGDEMPGWVKGHGAFNEPDAAAIEEAVERCRDRACPNFCV